MQYIYLDESGDLGFDFNKRKTSRHFVVTILFTSHNRATEKLISRIHSGLRKKYRMKSSALHAAKEESITVLRVCKGLVAKRCRIMTIFLDKNNVFTDLRQEKHLLYNYIVNILLDRIMNRRLVSAEDGVTLIASKRETNKFLNQNFETYLCQQLKRKHSTELQVKIKTPAEDKCLQAADIASWSIFRKYEYGDPSYYHILMPIIIEENELYK